MHVKYSPDDEAPQSWTFDPDRVKQSEAEMIEKRAGVGWDQWLASVRTGSARARRVLLWHLMRRDHGFLRYEDVPDFYMGQLVVEHSVAELLDLSEKIRRMKMDDDEREQVLSAVALELDEAAARENVDPADAEGKAPSRNAGADTPA